MGDFSQIFVDSQLFWHAIEETMACSESGSVHKLMHLVRDAEMYMLESEHETVIC